MRAMLAYDVIGFQTDTDRRNFANFCVRELGGEKLPGHRVRVGDRIVVADTFPIGIDAPGYARFAVSPEAGEHEEMVREMAGEDAISAMTLEHYPGMTEKKLQEIEEIARDRWPLEDVLIIHRYGRMEPGENIVLVVTASAHRKAAFESAEFLMDFLKTKAPFWKLEEDDKGDGSWVDAREDDDAAAAKWDK